MNKKTYYVGAYSQRRRYSNYDAVSKTNVGSGSTSYTLSVYSQNPEMGEVGYVKLINPSSVIGSYENVQTVRNGTAYAVGTKFRVVAKAYPGYSFVSWTGDYPSGQSQKSTIDIELTKNVVLAANFKRITQSNFTIGVEYDHTMGQVTGTGLVNGVVTAQAGTTIVLKATANAGYEFVRWEGIQLAGNVQSNTSAQIQLTVRCDLVLKAVFAKASNNHFGTPDGPISGGGSTVGGSSTVGGVGTGGGSTVVIDDLPTVVAGSTDTPVEAFLKKWWWALLIVAYLIYKDQKGGSK